jgi:hypothetical protein
MSEQPEFEPPIFNTHHPRLRGHFEMYDGAEAFENGEPEFDEVRKEIANHFGVPFVEEEEGGELSDATGNLFIIDNKHVENQRHHRAFCVVKRKEGDEERAWYIDGRMPHATMLKRLYGHYGVPEDDHNEISIGFLDDEGFPDIEEIQKKAKEQGKQIQWFIRETVSPS